MLKLMFARHFSGIKVHKNVYDMKGRGRSITVNLLKVHYSTRQYRRKRTARTPSVRCTTPMIETRQPSVLNGNIQTTTDTPSLLRLSKLKITAKHACYQCDKNSNSLPYKK